MFNSTVAAGLCFTLVIALGACAPQDEPIRIQSEPIFNKLGTVIGCSGGGLPEFDGTAISDGGIEQIIPCEVPKDDGECEAGSWRPHPLSPCMVYNDHDGGGDKP